MDITKDLRKDFTISKSNKVNEIVPITTAGYYK